MDQETQAADTSSYTLSLKGEGITLERMVAKDIALEIINVALGGVAGPRRSSESGTDGAGKPGGEGAGVAEPVTPGEFIESVNASSNPQKIVAFGVYLRDNRGEGSFTREDIKGMFRSAHESSPANFGRDFRNALSANWIAGENGPSDRYFVTGTGAKAVSSHFAEGGARRRRRPTARASSEGDDD
jgi:hypothetical protein